MGFHSKRNLQHLLLSLVIVQTSALKRIPNYKKVQSPAARPWGMFAAVRSESSVLNFILSFLWQWGDLGGRWQGPLGGVETVEHWEAVLVRRAHGLSQVGHLTHEFLKGLVVFQGTILDHLQKREAWEAVWTLTTFNLPLLTRHRADVAMGNSVDHFVGIDV